MRLVEQSAGPEARGESAGNRARGFVRLDLANQGFGPDWAHGCAEDYVGDARLHRRIPRCEFPWGVGRSAARGTVAELPGCQSHRAGSTVVRESLELWANTAW